MVTTERNTVEKLCAELFAAVEEAQGNAYHSDGVNRNWTRKQFFERARGRLAWARKLVRQYEEFLSRHGEFTTAKPHPTGAAMTIDELIERLDALKARK